MQTFQSRDISKLLNSLDEGEITFAPTYKFDRNTHHYDTSAKKRVPSYCDRILFVSNVEHLGLIDYRSVPAVTLSDHKPVVGLFQVYTSVEAEDTSMELQR
jgi:hypothetical protein